MRGSGQRSVACELTGVGIDQDERVGSSGGNREIIAVRGEADAHDFAADFDFAEDFAFDRINLNDTAGVGADREEFAAHAEHLVGRGVERDGAGAAETGKVGDDDGSFGGAGDEEPGLVARGSLTAAGGEGGSGGEKGSARDAIRAKVQT